MSLGSWAEIICINSTICIPYKALRCSLKNALCLKELHQIHPCIAEQRHSQNPSFNICNSSTTFEGNEGSEKPIYNLLRATVEEAAKVVLEGQMKCTGMAASSNQHLLYDRSLNQEHFCWPSKKSLRGSSNEVESFCRLIKRHARER